MIDKRKEIWVFVNDCENRYLVSNLGNVYSIKHRRLKKQSLSKTGKYPVVGIYSNNAYRIRKVHRVVMESFYGKSKLHINHKDGVKTNNSLINLEYCTQAENNKHARSMGLNKKMFGSENPNYKYTEKMLDEMEEIIISSNYEYMAACVRFKKTEIAIRAVLKRRRPIFYTSQPKQH